VAQLSKDGRRLASLLYSGPARPGGIYVFDRAQHWWNQYIDVYETGPGRKIATLSWTRVRGAQPPLIGVHWDSNRALLYSGERVEEPAMICETPPEIIPLPDSSNAAVILEGDADTTAKVSVRRIDGDGNGLVDSVDVAAEFMAPQPGSYRLSARFGRNEAINRFASSGRRLKPAAN
jgi:hypothetical protein